LGEDQPDTLRCAANLANDLHALSEVQTARALDIDTLDRYRRIPGKDHPDSLRSASNLADACLAAGRVDEAIML